MQRGLIDRTRFGNRLAFFLLHLLLFNVSQTVEDLVNDSVQPLLVRVCGVVKRNVDLAKHFVKFFPGELDEA
jgi:hypothetical protein